MQISFEFKKFPCAENFQILSEAFKIASILSVYRYKRSREVSKGQYDHTIKSVYDKRTGPDAISGCTIWID